MNLTEEQAKGIIAKAFADLNLYCSTKYPIEARFISGTLVKKLEWHTLGEVDESVLIFVQQELKNRGLLKGSFTFIIH